ncbi:hypothetical protein D9M71_709810 [compost metagenome]
MCKLLTVGAYHKLAEGRCSLELFAYGLQRCYVTLPLLPVDVLSDDVQALSMGKHAVIKHCGDWEVISLGLLNSLAHPEDTTVDPRVLWVNCGMRPEL